MAMSRGPRPRVPPSQAARAPLENTTCSTGRSLAANGPSTALPGCDTAKDVAFRITAGGQAASVSETRAAETGSFTLWAWIGTAPRPRAASASTMASTGASCPACIRAR